MRYDLMKRSFVFAMTALAAILAAPALAETPERCGLAESCHGNSFVGSHGWMLLVDDAIRENFQNMTIAEITALKEQKIQELMNMTPAQIEEKRQQKMKERDNMTIAELKDARAIPEDRGRERSGGKSPMGEMKGAEFQQGNAKGIGPGPSTACPLWLLDSLTGVDLNNMTLAEIKELKKKMMEELNNMTLAEIEKLREQKRGEFENMTISELKDRCGPLGGGNKPGMAFGPKIRSPGDAMGAAPNPGR
jgi:DNA-binding IscR family transcriptional regulator